MRMHRALLTLALLAIATPVFAQSGKKVLTQADYDLWRSAQGAALSNDGGWAVYTIQPLVGEGELVVRNTRTGTEYRHTRGFTGRPPAPGMPPITGRGAGPGEEDEEAASGSVARFTADSKHLIFIVQPSREEVERAQASAPRGRVGRAGGAGARPPERNSLAIMSLSDGKVTLVPGVRSFELAQKSGRYVAYLLQADPPQGQNAQSDSTNRLRNRKTFGSTMVLRELATATETRVDDVQTVQFNVDGSTLAYVVSSRANPASDGVFFRNLASGAVTPVLAGVGNYRQLAFDRAGQQVTFVSDRDEYATSPQPGFKLYYASVKATAAKAVVASSALSDGGRVADRGGATFTRDGSAIQFAIAPVIPDSIPYDSLASKAIYDLWHWQDPRLQSQQQLSLGRDRNRTLTGLHHIALNKTVQLTDDVFPNNPTLSDNGKVGVQNTGTPYMIDAMWGEGGTDIYLLDATTGTRKLLLQRADGSGTLSPAAKYVTWFQDAKWHAYNIATGKTVDLTGSMGVKFDQETHSTPSTPPAWGIAGWTPNDASVLINDRYDVWEIDPAGVKPARVVTDSVGRRTKTTFRVVNLDPEERFIDPAKPLLLRAVDDVSKASGFYQDRVAGNVQPTKIVMVDRNMGEPQKAREAEQYLLTQSTVSESELWTGSSLTALSKISDLNPQQKDFRWPTVELVSWYTSDGVPTRGLLYKPNDFDPSKKYPMVVYFYETHTAGLHGYSAPSGRNIINVPVYVSKGYLVFEPDIVYKDGYPGPSALKTIVPGVQMLVNKGFVKEDGIGIQGQSWGGYQTSYIITQSNLFKAAMAGAPVANMTSAYGGIRWESGNSRTGQYEHGQSRIGGSPWEFPERFIENSPLFYADRVQTPLLIMHNDQDGAVPWQQGIELYIALRRLKREAYMLNYNGDAHNPRKRANQRDMDIKMQEFFDHHLTGAPMPDWMKTGIPMLQKGKDQIAPPKKVTTTTTTTGQRQN